MIDVTDSAHLGAPVASSPTNKPPDPSNWPTPDGIVGTLESADGSALRVFTRESLIGWARSFGARDERCAFDGLEPGRAYGLVCSCSRCSPRCGGTS